MQDIESAFSPENLQTADAHDFAIDDATEEIKRTAEAYLNRMGCENQVNPGLLERLSLSIARSRQSDMYIPEQGEIMANISLQYIAQASSLWGQIMGAIRKEGAFDDEDNHGFSAGSDR